MNKHYAQGRECPRRQRGASAMEFALIFPVLFGVTYVIVIYSFMFVISQSLNFAAQEAAEAAVAISPRQDESEYQTEVRTLIQQTVDANVAWMGESTRDLIQAPEVIFCTAAADAACPLAPNNSAVVVKLRMTADPDNRLFATFNLAYFGSFPPIPTLSAQAVSRL